MSCDRDADKKIDQSLDNKKDLPKESSQSKRKNGKGQSSPGCGGELESSHILKKSKFIMNSDDCFG